MYIHTCSYMTLAHVMAQVRLLMMVGFEAQLLLQLPHAPTDVADADLAATALLDEFPSLTVVVISLPGKAYVTRCSLTYVLTCLLTCVLKSTY